MAIRKFDPDTIDWLTEFSILGEPASKANQRRIVKHGNKIRSIKSAKALNYVSAFAYQCPKLVRPLDQDLVVAIEVFYASRRPDLDESLILDAMQGPIYVNDRQVKERHIYWALDKENPRIDVKVAAMNLSA
tara:strand:+ start:862 stop:1257 length:396 start_codon:yes stop_codon:yes gene_type:complete